MSNEAGAKTYRAEVDPATRQPAKQQRNAGEIRRRIELILDSSRLETDGFSEIWDEIWEDDDD